MNEFVKNILRLSNKKSKDKIEIKFDNIIAITEQYLAKLENNTLFLSNDYGITYSKSINVSIIGDVRMIHIFSNGKVIICGRKKAYYTDFITLNESLVYDYDGSLWTAKLSYDNFYTLNGTTVQKLSNGNECLVWGCYNNDENINQGYDNIVECFETIDYGATIRVVWRNKITPTKLVNGVVATANCRHIHEVELNKNDGSFWMQTGDEPNDIMCHWIRGVRNTNGIWEWQIIGTGSTFKTTQLKFLGDYIIYAKDLDGGGICKVHINDAGDISKHVQLINMNVDPYGFAMSPSGKIVVIPMKYFNTNYPGQLLTYSADLQNWFDYYGEMPDGFGNNNRIFGRIWQPNSKGMVLCSMQPFYNQSTKDFRFRPSVFLDDILKKNGIEKPFI